MLFAVHRIPTRSHDELNFIISFVAITVLMHHHEKDSRLIVICLVFFLQLGSMLSGLCACRYSLLCLSIAFKLVVTGYVRRNVIFFSASRQKFIGLDCKKADVYTCCHLNNHGKTSSATGGALSVSTNETALQSVDATTLRYQCAMTATKCA